MKNAPFGVGFLRDAYVLQDAQTARVTLNEMRRRYNFLNTRFAASMVRSISSSV